MHTRVAGRVREQSMPTLLTLKKNARELRILAKEDRDFLDNNLQACISAGRQLGIIVNHFEEITGAIILHKNPIRLYPKKHEYYNELELIYYKIYGKNKMRDNSDKKDPRKLAINEMVLEQFNRAIQCNPRFAPAYNNRGLVYERQDKINEALEEYEKALVCDRTFALAYCNKSLIFLDHYKEVEKAIGLFETVATLKPNDAFTYDWLGYLYTRKKNYYRALDALALAIKFDPKDRRK